MEEKMSKKQKLIVGSITSLGTVGLYAGGVNLARNIPEYHNPIFISTIFVSLISPYILYSSSKYVIKKTSNKKQKKIKK